MTKADLIPVGELAGALVRLHHGWDSRRFFLVDGVEEGYRWFFSRELGKPGVVLLVAEVAGVIGGYVYGSLEERDWAKLLDAHGAIHDVYVAETHRRAGVARALMQSAIAVLEGQGAAQVVLSTAVPNREAQALFRSLGFRETMIEMSRQAARLDVDG
ncbi:MAG: GNAT family N-acetyltransferase [Myxococcales bacterium]|nr:GNAT family N-acetyltransferase [Myxococcales bacterium]MDP3503962.1 GNAT family N-acetyltransferase [Myxococcales bacterium]